MNRLLIMIAFMIAMVLLFAVLSIPLALGWHGH